MKVSPLKCTVTFKKLYLGLYNHHHCQILEFFSLLPKEILYPLEVTPGSLLPPDTLCMYVLCAVCCMFMCGLCAFVCCVSLHILSLCELCVSVCVYV